MLFSSFWDCQNNSSVCYSLETPAVFNITLGTLHFKMPILDRGFILRLCSIPSSACFTLWKSAHVPANHWSQPLTTTNHSENQNPSQLFWLKARLGIQGSPCVLKHSWHKQPDHLIMPENGFLSTFKTGAQMDTEHNNDKNFTFPHIFLVVSWTEGLSVASRGHSQLRVKASGFGRTCRTSQGTQAKGSAAWRGVFPLKWGHLQLVPVLQKYNKTVIFKYIYLYLKSFQVSQQKVPLQSCFVRNTLFPARECFKATSLKDKNKSTL